MPNRDNKSQQKLQQLFNAVIATDTDTNTTSVDTSDFDFGVMLAMSITDYDDGTYVLAIEDSPDDSVWTDVPATKLIGTPPSLGAATANGATIATLGVFSTQKFIRGVITSTITTLGATLNVVAVMKGEFNPQ